MKPAVGYCNNLFLAWFERVRTGWYNFVSIIVNVAPYGLLTAKTVGSAPRVALLVITQFADMLKSQIPHN